MTLHELVRALDLMELTPMVDEDPVVTEAYASDLLSDVLANAPAGGVLLTLQVHLNVIAVAGHADMAAVIFTSGRKPEDEVVDRAVQEGVALLSSAEDTFNLAGRLYALGVRGVGA